MSVLYLGGFCLDFFSGKWEKLASAWTLHKANGFPSEIPLLLCYFWAESVLLSQPAHGAEEARGIGADECTLVMHCSSWDTSGMYSRNV